MTLCVSLGEVWESFKSSPPWYLASMGFILGGVLASFLGVVIYRTPRGIGLGGRSTCACGRQLKVYENIPVIAWIAFKGQTRCCKERIPTYLFVYEALVSLAMMGAGLHSLEYLAVGIALFVLFTGITRLWLVSVVNRKQKSNIPHV